MCSNGPPWHDPHKNWADQSHGWQADRFRRRRTYFLRFVFLVGFLAVLFFIALALTLFVAFRLPVILGHVQPPATPPDIPPAAPRIFWLGLCAVPLGFVLLILLLGGLGFRRIGTPVADVMAAADAVAEGDLSVRLRENIPGELGRLSRSFNRMTGELARAEQQRRNLTADVAHELRTPLHIIQGNLEGVLDGVYQPSAEHIRATLEETRLLARLAEDLQTLSLAEAGQLPLHRVDISAADVLEDTLTSFAGQASAAGVDLRIANAANDEQLTVNADPDRIEQVLGNLVANALRYTPSGGQITLSARPIDGGVELSVQDSGAGIPAEDLPFIFDRFWKGDKARSRQGGGSGLGLAIARQVVQAHGGKISVESKLGEGTKFVVMLPKSSS